MCSTAVSKAALSLSRRSQQSLSSRLDKVDRWNEHFLEETAAATTAKIAIAKDEDAGVAFKEANVRSLQLQVVNLANDVEGQECLFLDNQQLLVARFAANVQDGFKPKQEQFDPDSAVMYIPGIGVYHGWYDIVEYSNINSDVQYNNYYHQYLITAQDVKLLDVNGAKNSGVNIKQRGISSWSNGTRVSEPWLNHVLHFTPCSSRTTEWTLTFDEDDNIDFFASGAYTNHHICSVVMNDCVGEHKQFNSLEECVSFYDALPKEDPTCQNKETGVGYALQGNTTLCRFLHHYMTKTQVRANEKRATLDSAAVSNASFARRSLRSTATTQVEVTSLM